MQQRAPADQVGGGDLVRRRARLGAEPGQRGLEPLVDEVLVEELVAGLQELPRHLQPADVGGLARTPQVAPEPAGGGHVLERREHRLVAGAPVGDERAVGLGVAVAADRRDRLAGAVEARGRT